MIPTVPGREDELRRSLHSLEHAIRPLGVDVVVRVESGHKTCGEAWNAGAAWLVERFAELDFLLFSADDLIADDRCIGSALNRAMNGRRELPAPQLFLVDGRRDPRTDDGPDGVSTYFSRVPFLPLELWTKVAPMPPLHYFSDAWIADRAHERGYSFRVTSGFAFVHLWSEPGRYADDRHAVDAALYADDARANPYRHLPTT